MNAGLFEIFFILIGKLFQSRSYIVYIAIETFKIINKETPQYLHDLVTLKNNKYNFRYSNTAHIPTVKTTRYGLNSFRYYASKTWNELPDHFRKETSFN